MTSIRRPPSTIAPNDSNTAVRQRSPLAAFAARMALLARAS
jgi:hypothetical protein